jgi:Flp pilus assembly pilin Flp
VLVARRYEPNLVQLAADKIRREFVHHKLSLKRRLNSMSDLTKRFLQGEEGQDLVEYALLLVFLALAAITVLPTLGKAVNNVFSQSASTLTTGS